MAILLSLLFSSHPRKKVHAFYHTFAEDEDPGELVADISNAYKQHISRFKRIFYRSALLKKPTVSIVKLSSVNIFFSIQPCFPLTFHLRSPISHLALGLYTHFLFKRRLMTLPSRPQFETLRYYAMSTETHSAKSTKLFLRRMANRSPRLLF